MDSSADPNPFSSPEVAYEPPLAAIEVPPYASGRRRAVWALLFKAAQLVLLPFTIGLSIVYFQQLTWLDEQAQVTREQLAPIQRVEFIQSAVGLLQLVLAIGGTVAYLMWVHRTYRNVPALGARGLRFGPGWAVGYYFIPIMNLFRPFQVMKETWQASDPEWEDNEGLAWSSTPSSGLLAAWWFFYLISVFAGQFAMRTSFQTKNVSDFILSDVAMIISDAVDLVSIPLIMLVIWRVDARQTQRSRRLGLENDPNNPHWTAAPLDDPTT